MQHTSNPCIVLYTRLSLTLVMIYRLILVVRERKTKPCKIRFIPRYEYATVGPADCSWRDSLQQGRSMVSTTCGGPRPDARVPVHYALVLTTLPCSNTLHSDHKHDTTCCGQPREKALRSSPAVAARSCPGDVESTDRLASDARLTPSTDETQPPASAVRRLSSLAAAILILHAPGSITSSISAPSPRRRRTPEGAPSRVSSPTPRAPCLILT